MKKGKLLEVKIAGTDIPVYVRKADLKKVNKIKLLEIRKGIAKEFSFAR